MEQSTQTNRTDIEYISIYEQRPKKKLGRPKGTNKFTDEEKLLRRRQANMKHYYNNHEYYKLYNRLHKAEIREGRKQINLHLFLWSLIFKLHLNTWQHVYIHEQLSS